MRIALGIEYDGSAFCGWQIQSHSPSVQQQVEAALSKVANHPIRTYCAGRTDTGVHALEQVVHFDTSAQRDNHAWVFGANAHLPASVTVLWAAQVADDFHARFSAERRAYRYVIFNRRTRPALLAKRVTWEYRPLDDTQMQQAALYLLGRHDFSAYRALACQAKSPIRELYELRVRREGELILLDLEANGFLHHMVRNIAGVLMSIGAGEQPIDWTRTVLEQRDRTLGGVTAPADGLYLIRVDYPGKYALPVLSHGRWLW
jgi:tRNA pseudouridine38-40 synthase